MEENLKSLELFEKVQDDAVEKMAPYLNQLWFKIIEKSLTKHSKRPNSCSVTNYSFTCITHNFSIQVMDWWNETNF